MPTKGKMTKQQRRFCEAYVVGLAEGQPSWWAAWQAGCCNTRPDIEPTREKRKYLASRASRLLRQYPHVSAYIDHLQTQDQKRQAQAHETQVAESPITPTIIAPSRERGAQGQVTELLGATFIARGRESESAANRRSWLAALELADLGPYRQEIERMVDQMTKVNP